MWLPTWIERLGFRTYYRLADLTYTIGIATPKRTVAGTYRSYEPTNPHGDDPGLVALDRLPEDATVLDVGAHVGEHAIPLALGSDRHVVAFEPNAESADRLARNADENGVSDRLDLRRVGLGDERSTATFYRSTFSKCSAFDRERATGWGARVAAVEDVPIRRLDDLVERGGSDEDGGSDDAGVSDPIPPPDAIKVDVEGRELAVLRGAERTIRSYRPLLVIEVHDETAPNDHGSPVGHGDPEASGEAAVRKWLADREYAVDERGPVWICRG